MNYRQRELVSGLLGLIALIAALTWAAHKWPSFFSSYAPITDERPRNPGTD